MPYLDIFGLEFENNIIMFETNTSNLSTCKISRKKQKCLNLGPKILPCVPYFWGGIWKYYCHIWNLRSRICLVAKFGAKLKIHKFWTKNALGFFGLEFKNNNVITLEFVWFGKFREKKKMSKLPYLGIFGLKLWKTIVIFEISTLEFL